MHLGAAPARPPGDFPSGNPICCFPQQAIIEGWNRVHNGHGADALLAHVVRQIRTWRPSVILLPAGRDCDGLPQIVEQTVVAAVKLAGDPTFLADQFGPAGCEPWNVRAGYSVDSLRDRTAEASPAEPTDSGPAQGYERPVRQDRRECR